MHAHHNRHRKRRRPGPLRAYRGHGLGTAAILAQWVPLRVLWGLEAHGVHHVPADGPVVLAANHHAYVDAVLVYGMAGRPVEFLAWERACRAPIVGAYLRAYDVIPTPLDGRTPVGAVREALRRLQAGRAVGLFPEAGRRSTIGPFRTGAVWLALAAGCPLIPVRVCGTDRVHPIGARLPRPGRIVLHFGRPMPLPADPTGSIRRDRLAREELTRELRARIVGMGERRRCK